VDFAGDSLTSPRQTLALTTGCQLTRQLEITGAGRYLDNIPYYHVPAYFELDLQLAWHPSPRWEAAVVGQNLLHDQHGEYHASFGDQSTKIARGLYVRVSYKF
jgi:iron complex outermembrane receptor protein